MRKDMELPELIKNSIQMLPDRNDPQYLSTHGGPIEHLAHTKEHLLGLLLHWLKDDLENFSLADRSVPLSAMDILFWEKCIGGFKRNTATAFTVDWGYLSGYPESPWMELFEPGDDHYMWWQITKMEPVLKLGAYGLWSIETNNKFSLEPRLKICDANSDFEIVFAKTDEIAILKRELGKFRDPE